MLKFIHLINSGLSSKSNLRSQWSGLVVHIDWIDWTYLLFHYMKNWGRAWTYQSLGDITEKILKTVYACLDLSLFFWYLENTVKYTYKWLNITNQASKKSVNKITNHIFTNSLTRMLSTILKTPLCCLLSLLYSAPLNTDIQPIYPSYHWWTFELFHVLSLFSDYKQYYQHSQHVFLVHIHWQELLQHVHSGAELLGWRTDVFSTWCWLFSKVFMEVIAPPAV